MSNSFSMMTGVSDQQLNYDSGFLSFQQQQQQQSGQQQTQQQNSYLY